jgi:hypothetical protein
MNEFKDQLDSAEKDKVTKLLAELREIAVKGQAADPSITAETIREKINETQQASLGLFQKVYFRLYSCLGKSTNLGFFFRCMRRRMQKMPLRHRNPKPKLRRRRTRKRIKSHVFLSLTPALACLPAASSHHNNPCTSHTLIISA